jgi:hypothetical protein
MYHTTIDCSEFGETYIYNGYSNNENTSILNAVKQYVKYHQDNENKFRLYLFVKDKESLSNDEVEEINELIAARDFFTYEIEGIETLDTIIFNSSTFYYENNILYIVDIERNKDFVIKESDIIQITEEQSNKIEDVKFANLYTDNKEIPLWAARYLYNNTDDEDLQELVASISDLKFFL